MFELPAWLLSWFYGVTHNYALAIGLIAVTVMVIITPLTLKSTKGMLEMQRLSPEMRKLQQQYRNDRQKLNEEMMKLYQEHKVNPMASCLPLLAQMPVFIIMFRVLHGLTYKPVGDTVPIVRAVYAGAGQTAPPQLGFVPRYISHTSELYTSLYGQQQMKSFGLNLAISPAQALADGLGTGLIYALLVVILAFLYFAQQRMVAARAAVSPTMSPQQQKLMQYLPVAFAVFQVFFLTGLIIYYMTQAVLRIGQQAYITRKFYGHEESLGRQAQRAGDQAREIAKADAGNGEGGPRKGFLAQMRDQAAVARHEPSTKDRQDRQQVAKGTAKAPTKGSPKGSAKDVAASKPSADGTSKRTTAPKGRPTPSGKPAQGNRPSSTRPGGARTKSSGGKRRR
jgi:YidC/Oxa1 family membrane protein insertase